MGRGRRLLALFLLGAALGAGCGGDDSKQSGSGDKPGATGEGSADGGGDCKSADKGLIAAARDHVGPLKVATAGSEEGQVDRISVDVCRKNDTEATAVVIVYGMRDDSIRDVRHDVGLIKVGPLWQVNNDLDTRRCQKGRGQQDFSGDICQ